ncbi:MAG: hypothetical protein K2Y33_03275 [Mycolicibacterium frederiksbergense]|nr:hypothetical protein [Mycolicibacterium frederiksbergense]
MTALDIVFLDTETLGLDPDAPIWEFAAVRRSATGGEDRTEFQIRHDATDWLDAMPDQFLYDYDERYKPHDAAPESDAAVMMHILTKDALVVACNPGFDLPRIERLIRRHGMEPAWHYHPLDTASMAIGYLAARGELSPQPWKSDALSAAVGIDPKSYARHTAMGDVLWELAQWDRITSVHGRLVEIPTVAFKGPADTDAQMFERAAENLDRGYEVGGGNVKAAVARLLRGAAEALKRSGKSDPESSFHAYQNRHGEA